MSSIDSVEYEERPGRPLVDIICKLRSEFFAGTLGFDAQMIDALKGTEEDEVEVGPKASEKVITEPKDLDDELVLDSFKKKK